MDVPPQRWCTNSNPLSVAIMKLLIRIPVLLVCIANANGVFKKWRRVDGKLQLLLDVTVLVRVAWFTVRTCHRSCERYLETDYACDIQSGFGWRIWSILGQVSMTKKTGTFWKLWYVSKPLLFFRRVCIGAWNWFLSKYSHCSQQFHDGTLQHCSTKLTSEMIKYT